MTEQERLGIPNIGAPEQEGPFLFLPGGFALAGTSVPYLSSSLSAEAAARLIAMPGDLPVDQKNPVVIAELFQRQVDEDHVEGIQSYLRSTSRLHFINAITVALLPVTQTPHGPRIADAYPPGDAVPLPQLPGYVAEPVGPIQLHFIPGNSSHGYLSWQKGGVLPVVLDGQHRLLAIKRLLAESFPGRSALALSKIPVLFLVLAPEAGFEPAPGQSVLSACRNVFIDLNLHPKKVSTARLYLLDDRNLTSACMRSVLAEGISNMDWTVPVQERVESTGRLPLAIVDWRSESAKFDGPSPAVTSLQALHASVARVLGVSEPDFTDLEEAEKYVERIALRLLSGQAATEFVAAMSAEIERCRTAESPFRVPESFVKRLAEGYRVRFGRRVTLPLTNLRPYRAMIDVLEERGWVATPFEPYFSLDQSGKNALLTQLDEVVDPASSIQAATAAVKGTWPLAFQVVFQRAMIDTVDSLLTTAQVFEQGGWSIEMVVDRINARVVPSLRLPPSVDSPFVGAGLRAEGVIDFRKTRIPSITGFMTYMVMSDEEIWSSTEQVDERVNEWLRDSFDHIHPGPPTGFIQAICSRHGAAWRRGLQDVAIVRGLGEQDAVLDLARRAMSIMVHNAQRENPHRD